MNFLAHAFLSFGEPEVLTGNMISDFVKGKRQYDFPLGIQAGIKLHRAIDHFTDQHAASKVISEIFRPLYRLYSAAFTDIVYDYFLANDQSLFVDRAALEVFSKNTYTALGRNSAFFPAKFTMLFPYMHSQDWLTNYQTDTGIERSFEGLGRRARYLENTANAFDLFMNNKALIGEQYEIFFPSVKKFASERMQELLKV